MLLKFVEHFSRRYTLVAIIAFGMLLSSQCTALPQNAPAAAVQPLPLVSPVFGDNMVLQRGKANTIWGWTDPGEKVRVEIADKTTSAIAAADRRWQVRIHPPPPGGPYTIKITHGAESVELHNVLVGDVWVCGGQSNMEVSLRFARNGEEEVKAAHYPDIRFFKVAPHPAYHHTELVEGSWQVLSPDTASRISAVAYYFARKIQSEIHVPIGLVIDSLGGTPAEAWTSAAALQPLHDLDIPLAALQKLSTQGAPEYGNYVMHWYDQYDVGVKEHWAAPELDDSSWKTVDIPGGFSELGVTANPAVAWFRKDIVLPDPLPSGRATLFLGSIERMDTAYINGTEVGASAWVENPRAYFIRDQVLKPGRNIIAIRVLKTKLQGGFLAKSEELRLVLGDKTSVPLAGQWKGELSVDARPPLRLPIRYENWPVIPSVLYEGMLAPIAPLSITGAIWYQGEQNSERGFQYRKILPVMIADWRKLFGQGDFPFYIVSLPAFGHRSPIPIDDAWAETRESQALTAARVRKSCLAVTVDTGDPDSIHPKDKLAVGERLALCALAKEYRKHVLYSGPTLNSIKRDHGAIRLRFTHTDGGLITKGSKLEEFEVSGDDRKWYWANARVEGNTVIVSSPSVPNPTQVRYAWQSNPAAALFNGAGLPAVPFRTDSWPGVTESQRPY